MKIEDVYCNLASNHITRMTKLRENPGEPIGMRGRPPVIPIKLGLVTKGWKKLTVLGHRVMAHHDAL
jgi:hypothetical protein